MGQGQITFSNNDFLNLAKLIQKQIYLTSYDLNLANYHENKRNNHPNTFCKYGKKMFSQADEDGITLEIINRLKIKNGNFIEFGVGDGLENNTIILLSLGWQGIWFGGENILINTKKSKRLTFYQNFITLKNILDLTKYALTKIRYIICLYRYTDRKNNTKTWKTDCGHHFQKLHVQYPIVNTKPV